MPGQVVNRREAHKKHTRAALEDAAMRLFAQQSFEATTVEEIAALAGVSTRTFFRYFASKQHVLFGDAAYARVSRLNAMLAARPTDEDPIESVRAVLESMDVTDPGELAQIKARMNLMLSQPSLLPVYLRISYDMQQEIGAFVAQRKGVPPTHPYPLTVSGAAAAAWHAAVTSWATGQSDDLAGVRRKVFAELSNGIAPAN